MNPPDTSKYPQPPPSYFDVPPPHEQPPYPMHAPHPTNSPYPNTPYPPPNPPYPANPPYHPHPTDTSYPPPPINTAQINAITVVAPSRPLGSNSEYVTCVHCNTQGWTRVETKPNMMTHTIALLLCCFILWPIAWLPYCCDACQSSLHYCSNCNAFIGGGAQI